MPEQFVVPQFIEVEDKIVGPISVRQFLIILVAAFIEFILFKLLTFTYFLVFGIPILIFTAILAFAMINGQPFHLFLLNIAITFKKPRLRVWYKDYSDLELRELIKKPAPPPPPPLLTKERPASTRLAELSLVVNTGGVYRPED
ncbi:MAG: PrgI family protein [bacterium]